jgi:hypothetical protein
MNKLLFALLAIATLASAAPAAAQIRIEAGPVAARIGPPPPPWWRRHHWRPVVYAYAPCHLVRERIVTPRGRVIIREREICP